MKLFVIALFQLLLAKRSKKDIYDRKPNITHYLADVQYADTRAESDYRHVYDPNSRVYTYAPKEYFDNRPVSVPPIGTWRVNPNSENVQKIAKRKHKKH
jgi:hypothetical protein